MKKLCIIGLLVIFAYPLLSQQDFDLRQIERDFRKKYRFDENSEIKYIKKKRMYGRDTVTWNYHIQMFDNFLLNLWDNMYIKFNTKEIIFDNNTDSTYTRYKDGRLNANNENSEWMQQLNEYNPFFFPLLFFKEIDNSKILSSYENNQKQFIVVSYTETDDLAEIHHKLWLNLTDTLLTKLNRKVESELLHLRKFIEVKYDFVRKDNPSRDFATVKNDVLSRGDRSKKYSGDPRIAVGDTLDNYFYRTLEGDTVKLQNYAADYFLIDLWYMACPPCWRAIPSMNEAEKEFSGVQVLGVNVADKNLEDLKAYQKKKDIVYDLVYSEQVTNDYHFAYPTFLILNSDGEVLKVMEGFTENKFEKLKKHLRELKEDQ